MTRIALISDIHFGKLSRSAEFSVPGEPIFDENTGGESLKSSMIDLFKEKSVNYLCVAGDLTSTGSPQEFSFCEKFIMDVAEKSGISNENIIVGLGNHDIDWKISNLYNTNDLSNVTFPHDLVKEKYRKIAASASTINLESIPAPAIRGPAPFSGIVENSEFIMFILNSGWCCTEDQAISRGRLDSEQLRWFDKEATRFKTDERWKIVILHHHPFNYKYPLPLLDVSQLEEGSELLDIAGKNGIHLILHGHRHHPNAETYQKNGWLHPISFVCAGSLAVNSSHRAGGAIPNTLHIIELTKEVGIIRLLNYQYSPVQGWIPIPINCPEIPLDNMMMFGKIFDRNEVIQSIQKLTEKNQEIQWEDLDDSLRFMPFDDLNDLISMELSPTYTVIGQFPKEIILIKKGIIHD